ncbi:MAG: glycosyltransferase family 2 protein, partial [Endomicrobia bacterium]|nr:glycosyltransferase family 2 protein [Endomicrobiia bacterium]
MNNPELSVIYVNYNTKKLLADSVNSVFEKTKDINFEIIIVDNSSTDGSVEELGKIFGDKIKIISSPNLGFGHGMNTGIKSAKGKYVFLFNTDTLLINNAIKILYDYMETNPKCAGAGANSYNEKNVPNCSKCFFLKENSSWLRNLFTHNVRRKFLWTYHVYSNKPVKVEYPTFAAILLRKDIFEKTGGFDEDFFMFCEDEELAFRITKA